MKTVNTVVKLLSVLAAVAGAIYIIATYGEQITAWAKKTLASLPKCPCCKDDTPEEAGEENVPDEPVEEPPVEEPAAVEVPDAAPVAPPAEAPAAPAVGPHEPIADEADFVE